MNSRVGASSSTTRMGRGCPIVLRWFMHRCTAASSVALFTGLTIYSSAPSEAPVEGWSMMVTKTTGIPVVRGSVLKLERRSQDRKSTRLNSSHQIISYAVFCLKKKKKRATDRRQCHLIERRATTSVDE